MTITGAGLFAQKMKTMFTEQDQKETANSEDEDSSEEKCFYHTVSAILWLISTVFVVYFGIYAFNNPDVTMI